MSRFLTRISRPLGLDDDHETAAVATLGPEHPLTRSISRMRTFAAQSLVATAAFLLAAAGVLAHVAGSFVVLGASLVVALAFLAAWMAVKASARVRAEEVIASGRAADDVVLVARERRRLSLRGERERLARTLESLLRDAQRWHEMRPPARPLPGVECLRDAAPEVAQVVARLQADRARVQGVALTSRLLCDGNRSPLYAGDPGRLRQELRRISYLLEAAEDVPERRLSEAA
jgi:hypothetical protein